MLFQAEGNCDDSVFWVPASFLSLSLSLSLSYSLSLNSISISGALLTWETYVNIAKASEIDIKQKWNKQYKCNSKNDTHKSSKRIKTFQMSYNEYIQWCNDVQITKVQKEQ